VIAALALVATVAAATGDPNGVLRFADAKGGTVRLDTAGVVYLVDFWALGCKPCIEEMPELARLAKEYEPSGRFRLVSVVWGGWKGSALVKVAEEADTNLPIYSDPENWHDRLDVDGFPTKLLVLDGTVVVRKRGGGAGAYDQWKAAIENALKVAPAAAAP
jgi:thiol-disulfide isomerase/thioredoxin